MIRHFALAALLASLASAAAGQTPLTGAEGIPTEPGQPPPVTPARGRHAMADRFAAADTNGDGRVTLAEAKAAHWHKVVANFAAIDADHDGTISLEELRAWRRAQRSTSQGPELSPPQPAPP